MCTRRRELGLLVTITETLVSVGGVSNLDTDPIYATFLRRCSEAKALSVGTYLHCQMVSSGLVGLGVGSRPRPRPKPRSMHRCRKSSFLDNLLLQMYGSCGKVDAAHALFLRMGSRDLFSWTYMIRAFSQNGHGREAVSLFRQMEVSGICPNAFTFPPLLSASAELADVSEGKQIHSRIVAYDFHSHPVLNTALIHMYSSFGILAPLYRLFNRIPNPDAVSWTAIITGFAKNGQLADAIELFEEMQRSGAKTDAVVFVSILGVASALKCLKRGKLIHACVSELGLPVNTHLSAALVDMYGKCNRAEEACLVFDKLQMQHNAVVWTAMISAYARNGHPGKALELFFQMDSEGLTPDRAAFLTVLNICADLGFPSICRDVHEQVKRSEFGSDVSVENAVVSMYAKCGHATDARLVFDGMPCRDLISFNSVISVYTRNGRGGEALKLFECMKTEGEGLVPDEITFLHLLDACNHAGLLNEARRLFLTMFQEHGIAPLVDHYVSLVDVFGRAGQLDEAHDLIANMSLQCRDLDWKILLGSCLAQGDVERGIRIARCVFEHALNISNPSVSLL